MTNAHSFKIFWPLTNEEKEIRLEPSYYDRLLIYHPTHFMNLFAVHKVLNNPQRIFSGVRRPVTLGDEKFCVVGKPNKWYITETDLVPFPSDKVFTVYLNERFSIYEFGADAADYEDRASPKGYKNRFGELEWTNS